MILLKCPSPEDLSRAFSEGPDDRLRLHFEDCAECRRQWDEHSELVRLGRQLSFTAPEGPRLDHLRQNLLAAAAAEAEGPLRRAQTPYFRLAAAAAVLLVAGVGIRSLSEHKETRSAQTQMRATVHPQGAARYDHLGPSQDEIVRLADGSILVEVDKLQKGERFRVVTGDGEVEVWGTVFEVTAAHDHLLGVRVLRGKVEVRPPGGGSLMLQPGGRWQPASATTAPKAPPAPAETPALAPVLPTRTTAPKTMPDPSVQQTQMPPLRVPARHRPAHLRVLPLPHAGPSPLSEKTRKAGGTPGPAELAFDEGWGALRAGRFAAAAESFQHATTVSAGQPIDEDAWFWRAVAWARAGRNIEAVRALHDFLGRYPRSARSGEASSILGWLLVDTEALDEAERRFQAASTDRDTEVRESAREGLVAVAARRGRPASP